MVFKRPASILAPVVLAAIVKLSVGSEATVRLSLASEASGSCGSDAPLSLLQTRSRELQDKGSSNPYLKVVFIRTHFTGSSTLSSIFKRFCVVHHQKLSPHLPFQHGKGMVNASSLRAYAKEHQDRDHVQIWDAHMEYDSTAFRLLMPGAVKVSLFREPKSRLISGYSHKQVSTKMIHQTLANLKSNVSDPEECRAMSDQVPSLSDVDLVLMTEDYDRSLVLMGMKLRWNLEDLLYQRVRESPEPSPEHKRAVDQLMAYVKQPLSTMPEKAREYVQVCYLNDMKMYNAANRTYHKQLADLTPHQQSELENGVARLQSAFKVLSECCEGAPADPYCHTMTLMEPIRKLPDRYFESHCRHRALKAIRA